MGTIGYPTYTTTGGLSANYKRACPVTMSEDGYIDWMSGYFEGGGTSDGNCILALYSDSSGLPNTRLCRTGEITVTASQSAGWAGAAISPNYYLAAGSYWICIITADANMKMSFWTSGGTRKANSETYSSSTSPSASFGSPTTQDAYYYSLVANYYTSVDYTAEPDPLITESPTGLVIPTVTAAIGVPTVTAVQDGTHIDITLDYP